MEFEILCDDNIDINFSPKTLVEEVTQNVKTILNTAKYSVPLNREFGITANMLDDPMPAAKAKLIAEVFDIIPKYEPRVRVTNVKFFEDVSGLLRPKVGVALVE